MVLFITRIDSYYVAILSVHIYDAFKGASDSRLYLPSILQNYSIPFVQYLYNNTIDILCVVLRYINCVDISYMKIS